MVCNQHYCTNSDVDYAYKGKIQKKRTKHSNDNSAIIFIMQPGLTYSAIILFVTCFTILALQQLSDSGKYKYRFRVLRNMGVEEPHIIISRKNRRTHNRNQAVHIEQNAVFTFLIFCFPAPNHRYHSYPTSFFSNHFAVKHDSTANQTSEMTNTSIIIQNAIAVL